MENENLVEEQKNEQVEEVTAEKTTADDVAVLSKPSSKGIWRKITSIALLVLASVIMIGVVLMSTIKKDLNYGFNAPDVIELHTESSSNINNLYALNKGTKNYNKFMELYNDSFKTTLFGAMFQGKLGAGIEVKEGYKSLSSLSNTYVEFFYTESQTLKVNGKTYENVKIVSNTDYISIIIELKNTNSLDEAVAYFKYRETGTNNYSYVRLVTFATQANLYDFVENGEL